MLSYDVIIPTHDNLARKSGSVALAIKSLLTGSTLPNKIIIVSNGDNSPECKNFLERVCSSFPKTSLLAIDRSSRSAARNAGLKFAKAEGVLFIDDDIIVSPEALESFVRILNSGHFCCGARRRFIPYGWSYEEVESALDVEENFKIIDMMASDIQSVKAGPRGIFDGQLHKVSFISCFGGAPREAISSVGGFDEGYDGWGLEDTDLMRRLMRNNSYTWLGDVTVWHLDHLITPYTWSEHWDLNWPKYLAGVRDHGFLHVTKFFSKSHIAAADPEVLQLPLKIGKNQIQKELSQLDEELQKRLMVYVEECGGDTNVAAIVLNGSSLTCNSPNDIDISKVVFKGGQRFSVFGSDSVPFDQHEISLRSVKEILSRPQYMADNWLWWAHRYYSGIYVYEAVECKNFLHQLIQATLEIWWLHFLTFHIGRALAHFQEEKLADRGGGIRHIAAVIALSEGTFPSSMRYPYIDLVNAIPLIDNCERMFSDPSSENTIDGLICLIEDPISCVVDRYLDSAKQPHIVYRESAIAMQAIESILNIQFSFEWKALRG